MSDRSVVMRAVLKQIEDKVHAMGSLAQNTTKRLEKAEEFIRKLGYCPYCQKKLVPRGVSKSAAFHGGYCRCTGED